MKATIVIPVYNSPELVVNLLDSIIRNTNPALVAAIIIGDDHSDTLTKTLLQEFEKNSIFNIKIVTNPKNIGYLRNSNHLFSLVKSEIAIFLNSDVQVPPNWLERMLRPFALDNRIALASPFSNNAGTLTIYPNEGQSWLAMDQALSSMPPQYPHAHMVIGYALAIRCAAIEDEQLFDESYHPGYGEENDLQFRLLKKNYHSVVVDNLLLYHAGSASFYQYLEVEELKRINGDKFLAKWESQFYASRAQYEQENVCQKLKHRNGFFAYRQFNQYLDVLFFLAHDIFPDELILYIKLCDWLNQQGRSAAIYINDQVGLAAFKNIGLMTPWYSLESLKKQVNGIKVVISSELMKSSDLGEICRYYKSKFIYWMKYFYDSSFMELLQEAPGSSLKIDKVICPSERMKDILTKIISNPIEILQFSPSAYMFYPNNQVFRNTKAIVAYLPKNAERINLVLSVLTIAKKNGFEIYLFGEDLLRHDLPCFFNLVDIHKNPRNLRDLFSSVGYYLNAYDSSGTQLLTLQATFCGAIPIVYASNSLCSDVYINAVNSLVISQVGAEFGFFSTLMQMDGAEISLIRQSVLNIKERNEFKVTKESILSFIDILCEREFYQEKISMIWVKSEQNRDESNKIARKLSFKYKVVLLIKRILSWIFVLGNRGMEAKLEYLNRQLQQQNNMLSEIIQDRIKFS